MKKLQQLFGAVVLTFLLSISGLAADGIIVAWKTQPPPGSVMTTTDVVRNEGIITIGATSDDSVTEVLLSLLPSVLALF